MKLTTPTHTVLVQVSKWNREARDWVQGSQRTILVRATAKRLTEINLHGRAVNRFDRATGRDVGAQYPLAKYTIKAVVETLTPYATEEL